MAAGIAVLVGRVGRRGVRVCRVGVGVAPRAAVGRAAGKGTLVLGVAGRMQAVDRVNVRESGGELLVGRMSVAKFEKGRFGGIRGVPRVRHQTHRHH